MRAIKTPLIEGKVSYFDERFVFAIIMVHFIDTDGSFRQSFRFSYTDDKNRVLSFNFKDKKMIPDLLEVIGYTLNKKENRYSSCNIERLKAYVDLRWFRHESSWRTHISEGE